jgi:acetyl-CoA C-acetyltransferase
VFKYLSKLVLGVKKESVQECLMGNVLSANLGQAPARQAALQAGLSESTICTTVNKVCASGMKAISLGAQSIMLGYNNIVVAGGMENMSRVPYYLDARRGGLGFGDQKVVDAVLKDGLWDTKYQMHMGGCAEETASKMKIGREEQDAYARESYERAANATKNGKFKNEIAAVRLKNGVFEEDEEFKKVNFDKMPQLKPAFKAEGGTITAANSSTLSDGAAAVLLTSTEVAEAEGLKPLARIVSFADSECNPKDFPIAPSLAVPLALKRAGINVSDVDLFEINEAFSVVALANQKVTNNIIYEIYVFSYSVWI